MISLLIEIKNIFTIKLVTMKSNGKKNIDIISNKVPENSLHFINNGSKQTTCKQQKKLTIFEFGTLEFTRVRLSFECLRR